MTITWTATLDVGPRPGFDIAWIRPAILVETLNPDPQWHRTLASLLQVDWVTAMKREEHRAFFHVQWPPGQRWRCALRHFSLCMFPDSRELWWPWRRISYMCCCYSSTCKSNAESSSWSVILNAVDRWTCTCFSEGHLHSWYCQTSPRIHASLVDCLRPFLDIAHLEHRSSVAMKNVIAFPLGWHSVPWLQDKTHGLHDAGLVRRLPLPCASRAVLCRQTGRTSTRH